MTLDDLSATLSAPQLVRLSRLGADLPAPLVAALTHAGPTGSLADHAAELALSALPATGGPAVAAADPSLAASLAALSAARGRRLIVVVDGDLPLADRNRILAFGADLRPCPPGATPDDVRSPHAVAARVAAATDRAVLIDWDALDAGPLAAALETALGEPPGALVLPPGGAVLAAALRRAGVPRAVCAATSAGTEHTVRVERRDALLAARRAARTEGVMTGEHGGAALAAALRVAQDSGTGRPVVALLTGRGVRALTTVFDDDWMRRHHLLPERTGLTAGAIAAQKEGGPRELVVLAPGETVAAAVRLMQDLEVSQIPILDEGAVVGTVREDQVIDLLLHAPDRRNGPVAAVMDDALPEVDAAASVEEVQSLLVEGHTAVLVRMPGGGRDILTKYDLIHGLTRA